MFYSRQSLSVCPLLKYSRKNDTASFPPPRHKNGFLPICIMASLLHGEDIAKLLRSDGPIVKCVLLRASTYQEQKRAAVPPDTTHRVILNDLIEEIQVDTTPKKSMVSQILGGPFTFLGQYEEEGIVLMCTTSQDAPLNPHQLQPPLTECGARGDILIMKVAPIEEMLVDDNNEEDEDDEKAVVVPTNEEFFLDYSKEEYIAFASRNDVVAPEIEQDKDEEEEEEEEVEEEEEDDAEYNVEDDEEDGDEDDSESQVAMMNLIMGQVLRRFHEENGRGPDTRELLDLRSALAEKIGVEVPEVEGADWDQKASKKTKKVVDREADPTRLCKPILTKKRSVDEGKLLVEEKQEAKRVKFFQEEVVESTTEVTRGES